MQLAVDEDAGIEVRLRAVAQRSSTVDSLRVAVLAALNLADELAMARTQIPAADPQMAARAENLHGVLDDVLAG